MVRLYDWTAYEIKTILTSFQSDVHVHENVEISIKA